MSNQTSRTTSASIIREPVVRTATITSPNSYRRVPKGESPTRWSNAMRAASDAIKSKAHVSLKRSSIKPQLAKKNPINGSSTRINVHSRENEITPNSVSTRKVVRLSRHRRKMEKAPDWSTIDPPRFRSFAQLPTYVVTFLATIQARNEAAISRSSTPLPSLESPATLNARGRNYSARSAKRKRP